MRGRNFVVVASVTVAVLAGSGLEKYTPAERRHWSFQPRSNPTVPTFPNAIDGQWVQGPIDAFVLAKLRAEGLGPAPRADRATLIRRVTFDLTGLPPSP